LLQPPQQLTDGELCFGIQADGWLIKEEDIRFVEECRRKFAAHPLAKTELAYALRKDIPYAKTVDEQLLSCLKSMSGNLVKRAQQGKRVGHGEVPPKLCPLPKDDANVPNMLLTLGKWFTPIDIHIARIRLQNAA
jgi:hypothetical protein